MILKKLNVGARYAKKSRKMEMLFLCDSASVQKDIISRWMLCAGIAPMNLEKLK